jgi:hypothetical protein
MVSSVIRQHVLVHREYFYCADKQDDHRDPTGLSALNAVHSGCKAKRGSLALVSADFVDRWCIR